MKNKKDYVRRLSRTARTMYESTPAKVKACGLALIAITCSDLAVNLDCIGRLMSVDTATVDGVIRCGVIALALTCLILAFGAVCGDRAKRFYCQRRRGAADGSHLAIAIVCACMNVILIGGVTYLRWKVGSADAVTGLASQASQALQASMATGTDKHSAEVLLLALMLGGAAIFSTAYGFTATDPNDLAIASSIKRAEAEIRANLAANASKRSDDFTTDSLAIIDHIADAARCRARDHVISSLLSMATDPAIATRIYKAVEAHASIASADTSTRAQTDN